MTGGRTAQWLMWLALAAMLCVLYLPLVPPFLFSIGAHGAHVF